MEGIFDSLIPEIQHALKKEGYATPTPVQAQAIPPLLEAGARPPTLFILAPASTSVTVWRVFILAFPSMRTP